MDDVQRNKAKFIKPIQTQNIYSKIVQDFVCAAQTYQLKKYIQ